MAAVRRAFVPRVSSLPTPIFVRYPDLLPTMLSLLFRLLYSSCLNVRRVLLSFLYVLQTCLLFFKNLREARGPRKTDPLNITGLSLSLSLPLLLFLFLFLAGER